MENVEKCLVQKYQFPHLSGEVERKNIEYNVLFWNNQLFGSANENNVAFWTQLWTQSPPIDPQVQRKRGNNSYATSSLIKTNVGEWKVG